MLGHTEDWDELRWPAAAVIAVTGVSHKTLHTLAKDQCILAPIYGRPKVPLFSTREVLALRLRQQSLIFGVDYAQRLRGILVSMGARLLCEPGFIVVMANGWTVTDTVTISPALAHNMVAHNSHDACVLLGPLKLTRAAICRELDAYTAQCTYDDDNV